MTKYYQTGGPYYVKGCKTCRGKAPQTPKSAEGVDTFEQFEDKIYPPTMGHCGVCGQRGYQHTCDQAYEAVKALIESTTKEAVREFAERVKDLAAKNMNVLGAAKFISDIEKLEGGE